MSVLSDELVPNYELLFIDCCHLKAWAALKRPRKQCTIIATAVMITNKIDSRIQEAKQARH